MSITRVGQVRPSQLLYTYGPGALVDLPHLSVVVHGIDRWTQDPAKAREITERRLLAAVKRRLGPQVESLRLPPHLEETQGLFDDWTRTGVPVSVFPRWLRCPACDRMMGLESKLFVLEERHARPDQTLYRHTNCPKAKKAPPAVPVRFLLACRKGHLDEFPWESFVHRGHPCASPILSMTERGQSTATADIFVNCLNCDTGRSMADAFGETAKTSLPKCRGRHPHLGLFDASCTEQARAALLGASNQWFSVAEKVFSLPAGATPLEELVEEAWTVLDRVPSEDALPFALENVPTLAALKAHEPADVWKEIQRRRGGTADVDEDENLRLPEWTQFSDPTRAVQGIDFQLREVPVPPGFDALLERVVLAERLREVVALVGFTRIDPPGEADTSGHVATVVRMTAHTPPTWAPCTEVRGEGLFVQLQESVVAKWEADLREHHGEHVEAIEAAHRRWRRRRNLDETIGFPGFRYLALHTFSHLLIREVALECGYGASALAERIYSHDGSDGKPAMAGILVYTAAPDSEGTLGGLISLGEPDRLGPILRRALASARLCSSDPICAEHVPSRDEDVLHAAACHACLFAPETACERANRYLDRSLIVETFSSSDRALFRGI